MNKTTLIMILLGMVMIAHAKEEKKIYKYTDENGVTHYSEKKPTEDYKEADLPPLSVVPSTPVRNVSVETDTDAENNEEPAEAQKFELLQPVKEQNLWGTGGKLTAQVTVLTDAQKVKYQVQFIINGKKQKPGDETTQVFDDIFRGEHTVQALLINRFNQKVVRKTETVTFFMHQNSKK